MTAQSYNNMVRENKLKSVYDDGMYIDERLSGTHHVIKFHALHGFYVLIYYDLNKNQIDNVCAMDMDSEELLMWIDVDDALPKNVNISI